MLNPCGMDGGLNTHIGLDHLGRYIPNALCVELIILAARAVVEMEKAANTARNAARRWMVM